MGRICLVVLSLFLATPSLAEVSILACSMKTARHDWTGKTFALAHEPGAGSATVANDVTLHFLGGAVKARVLSENRNRLRLRWQVRTVDARKQVTTMVYRATVNTASMKVSVSAEPLGYSQRFTGRGECAEMPEAEKREFRRLLESAVEAE